MFLVRDKLIMQGEKCETSTQNLQRNNVARQVEGIISQPLSVMGHFQDVHDLP